MEMMVVDKKRALNVFNVISGGKIKRTMVTRKGHLLKSRQLGCGNLAAVFWLLKLLKKVTGSPGCNRDQHRLPITQMVVQILHKWVFDKVDLRTLYPDWGLGQRQSHQPFLRPAPPFLQSVLDLLSKNVFIIVQNVVDVSSYKICAQISSWHSK